MGFEIPGFGILGPLGMGGTAAVLRVRDLRRGEVVALKVLRPECAGDRVARERFLREGLLLKAILHPHIVRGFDAGRRAGLFYMALELLPGPSLLGHVGREGPMPEGTVLRYGLQALAALEHLHTLRILHGDVKPGNLLLAGNGIVKLSDLGFARRTGPAGKGETGGTTFGTPQYISPEQARGAPDLDHRADLYSLGATLFHLLTGAVPFPGADPEEAMRCQVRRAYPFERLVLRRTSPGTRALLDALLRKERAERPSTTAAARRLLSRAIEALETGERAAAVFGPPAGALPVFGAGGRARRRGAGKRRSRAR